MSAVNAIKNEFRFQLLSLTWWCPALVVSVLLLDYVNADRSIWFLTGGVVSLILRSIDTAMRPS